MSAAIPERVSVTLPVGRIATATTYSGEDFQPVTVEWRAFTGTVIHAVVVTATARGRQTHQNHTFHTAWDDTPEWVPAQPEWFVEQVARMERVAKYDREQAKRADALSDMTQGLA